MSDFLENLKKAVDEGEFNSEAAKKINSIDEMATEFAESKSIEEMEESVTEKATEGGVKTVSEDEMAKLNSDYEEKMKARAAEEIFFAEITALMNKDVDIERLKNELQDSIRKQREFYPRNDQYEDIHTLMDHLVDKYEFEM